MNEIRYYFYELISVAFGIALLFFFGTLLLFPFEILIEGEKNSIFLVIIFLSIGAISTYLLISFINGKYKLTLIRIFEIFCTISSILVLLSFFIFSNGLNDAWIFQSAWYIRYNGLIIGILLGIVVGKVIVGLDFLIKKFHDQPGINDEYPVDKSKNLKAPEVITVIILTFGFGIYIVNFLLFRFMGLIATFLFIFIIQVFLLISSSFLLFKSNEKWSMALPEEKIIDTREGTITNLNIENSTSRFKAIGLKRHWKLLIPVVLFLGLSIAALIFYYNEVFLTLTIPFGTLQVIYEVPLVQILSIILIIALFLTIITITYGEIVKDKWNKLLEGKRFSHIKRNFLKFLESSRFLGIVIIFSQVIYFFDYPLYMPTIISLNLVFVIMGNLMYLLIGRTQKK